MTSDAGRGELLRTLGGVVAIVAVFVALKYALVVATGVSSPIVVVKGTSMLPTFYNGDLVIIHKVPPYKIKVGDIIVYRSLLNGELVIHRVVKIVHGSGCHPVCYITKGDNNYVDDAGTLEPLTGISYNKVLGVVYMIHIRIDGHTYNAPLRIPYVGLIVLLFR